MFSLKKDIIYKKIKCFIIVFLICCILFQNNNVNGENNNQKTPNVSIESSPEFITIGDNVTIKLHITNKGNYSFNRFIIKMNISYFHEKIHPYGANRSFYFDLDKTINPENNYSHYIYWRPSISGNYLMNLSISFISDSTKLDNNYTYNYSSLIFINSLPPYYNNKPTEAFNIYYKFIIGVGIIITLAILLLILAHKKRK